MAHTSMRERSLRAAFTTIVQRRCIWGNADESAHVGYECRALFVDSQKGLIALIWSRKEDKLRTFDPGVHSCLNDCVSAAQTQCKSAQEAAMLSCRI